MCSMAVQYFDLLVGMFLEQLLLYCLILQWRWIKRDIDIRLVDKGKGWDGMGRDGKGKGRL